MSCQCAMQPLCQWCKKAVHACREVTVHYGPKVYHRACWVAIQQAARRTGGAL